MIEAPQITEQKSPTRHITKLFIVDDHEIARRGIKALFKNSEMTVVGEAECCSEALSKIPILNPDVILLDIKMPEKDGIFTLSEIRKTGYGKPVIMLTGYDNELFALEALKNHADAYITKDSSREFILNAIRVVVAGGIVWERQSFRKALNYFDYGRPIQAYDKDIEQKAPLLTERLSPREIQTIALVVKGYPNKEISRSLKLSEVTTKKLISSIFRKLGVQNRTQAALIARDLGLE